MLSNVTQIEVEGEAYERGRVYGARVADCIRDNAEVYIRLIERTSGIGREAALQAALSFAPQVEAHAPELLLEMQGIAAGADCDFSSILLINARSELMSAADECTSLAAAPGATLEGNVLLGQNWDWFTAVERDPILLRIRQPGRPEVLTLVEAGQVGKIGMNSAGLGVCLNFLAHSHRAKGLPLHVLLRQMLGSAHLGQAIEAVYTARPGAAANVMLAHRAGEILDLELTPTDTDYLYGDEGWLVHANHFESPRLRAGDTGIVASKSTLARAARARRLIGSAKGEISVETFEAILRDHAYGAYAICRHPSAGEPALQKSATRASLIMDLTSQALYLALGQPCRSSYEAFTLDA